MVREIDAEWLEFCAGTLDCGEAGDLAAEASVAPDSTPLYISTKTKICHLSTPIVLDDVFWKLPVTPYSTPAEGIIKKQMKFCSASPEELQSVEDKLRNELQAHPNHLNNQTIAHVVNPNGLIKFKDVRKISIGLSKKDIINHRCKQKSAFYNCFVVIVRIRHEGRFKEINVKVFNTGKLEIPGIQQDEVLEKVLDRLTQMLAPLVNAPSFAYSKENETVLINSNFKCNYLIKRDQLVDILKTKYNIKCSYDPCSYPGVQCTFFYDPRREVQTGVQPAAADADADADANADADADANADAETVTATTTKVSFMIFRTGSVLIVGRCTEPVLDEIYTFVRTLLKDEHHLICDATGAPPKEPAPTKKRLRTFQIEVEST